jgi:BCCT, betaine/carnitine/choline family transporter
MTAFGGTAITMLNEGCQAIADAALELKLFVMLEPLPLASITSFLGIVLVVVFFVTSSDLARWSSIPSPRAAKVDAPLAQRVFWAVFEGMAAHFHGCMPSGARLNASRSSFRSCLAAGFLPDAAAPLAFNPIAATRNRTAPGPIRAPSRRPRRGWGMIAGPSPAMA